MAVRFRFAASKALGSVPCTGPSISLLELKDAIAAPLVADLHGKKLREEFDFRVYDADTKEEIVGASARVRRYACVLVKRVPAYVVSQQNPPPVVLSSQGSEAVGQCPENGVVDDGFGEDVYSSSAVSTVTTVSSVKVENLGEDCRKNSEKEEASVVDGLLFSEGVSSRPTASGAASVVSREEGGEVQKEIRMRSNEESGAWNEAALDVPEELLCTLCKHVMKDAVLIPCCCNSYCHNCIKVFLLEGRKCPNCQSSKCRDADLLPNRHLRSLVDAFFKSNPSASSSAGSCTSETTFSHVVKADLQLETPRKKFANERVHISKRVGNDSVGKRKPLTISLNASSKRTKVL